MSTSIDGFFEGPNHDLSWHNVDNEFNRFAIDQLKRTDLFLWGRRTYQLMESYSAQGSRRYDHVAGQPRNRASDEQHPEICVLKDTRQCL